MRRRAERSVGTGVAEVSRSHGACVLSAVAFHENAGLRRDAVSSQLSTRLKRTKYKEAGILIPIMATLRVANLTDHPRLLSICLMALD